MSIARFSVTRPVAVTMRIAALVLLGAICLLRLPVDLLPKVSIPTVAVFVSWPNVAPEEMESQITRPLEQAVSSAPNLYQVTSSSTLGSSFVRIQFNWGTDVGQAAVDVLQLVQRAKAAFPNDPTLQSPTVFKFDPSAQPIRIYGISGMSDIVKLRTLIDNEVSPIIESANGVAAATVTGGQERAILVDVDPKRLEAFHLTLADVTKRLQQENINLPGGLSRMGNTELAIRSVGDFAKPEEILQVPIANVNGQNIRLSDIAVVSDSHQEQRIFSRLNGESAVGLAITKQSDANTISTARNIEAKVLDAQRQYPGLTFRIAYDQSGFIERSMNDLKTTAAIGGLLALGILMMFLRNFRSTMVVGLSIPISIISTFALLYFGGFTLNTISLSGLALATGLIVDDAVVVLENIFRHIERDKKRAAEAAVSGATEIMGAVVASTLTIMIVFLPLLMIKGQSGQTFTQFALVVIFSLAVSLLDATTVVPMLASRIISEREVEEEAHPELRAMHGTRVGPLTRLFDWFGGKFNAVDAAYRRGLAWAIHHRGWVLTGAGLSIVACLPLIPLLGSEMLPATDSGDFSVSVRLPIGTSLDKTKATMDRVEQILLSRPDVETVFLAAGANMSFRGASNSPVSYQGGATVRLKPNRKKTTQQVVQEVQRSLAQIPGIRGLVTPFDIVTNILTGGNTNMEVDVFSPDLALLKAGADQTLQTMQQVPGLESVDIGVQDAAPEVQWHIDRQKATQFGVTFSDVANAINAATNGTLSTYYLERGFQYPIYVEVPPNLRRSPDQIAQVPIATKAKNPDGSVALVRLGQVAHSVVQMGPNEIERIDRQRFLPVQGRLSGRSESEVQADIAAAMAKNPLQQGLRWEFGTNQRRRAEEFSGLGMAVFLAIALIYMLLASQFESFIYPLVVLTSVPLCSIGVVLSLFLTNRAFGLTAFIGLLMLIGIVVKNGILLVDYTNQLRARGFSRDEAVLTASPTRMRPILMTTSAAILGMFPLALALGRGSETQAPLATAVIGGLATSSLLTLFVVPVVYTLFDDLARKLRKDPRDLDRSEMVEPSIEATERTPAPAEPAKPRAGAK
ncbi:MAG: efflux RND transporter permease subunit [Fimbriimonas ginsengisoli]|uniref:Efflux RND transporter permease subunit n=1 Tax=Fimbriimonas ginsengisoli TaxID=1005039 RepID=A0A931LTZ6_FIMGI|nr:efflux RND transporter permease subunit [Fimbriimonas ginsengisoli]